MSDQAVQTAVPSEVFKLRERLDAYGIQKAELDRRKAEFEEHNADLIASVKSIGEEVEAAKEAIKPLAVTLFNSSGEKKLWGGIGIREKQTIEYDQEAATQFAHEKGMFLVLDTKAFEKAAPSLNLPFVKVEKVPQVTFPKSIEL